MSKPIYVVTMYRYGNRENHSYVLGAYFKKDKAIKEAEREKEYRGGTKYIPEVLEIIDNDIKTILKAEPITF